MPNLFPKLAGLTWEGTPVPTWATVKQRSKNGAVTALMCDPYPLWTFDLSYEFVRDSAPELPGDPANPENYSELQQLVGFYNAQGGSFAAFSLDPGMLTGRPDEGVVHGGPVGTGDGLTTTFYLMRDAGGFFDEVQNPIGAVAVSVNGVVQVANCTLGAAGAVTFATAPAAGAVITWDGRWQWLARFAEDDLGVKQFMYELYELQSVKLEQVKL